MERLRAALEALGPGVRAHVRSATGRTPRATGPRGRPAARLGVTPRVVRGNGRALSAVGIGGSGAGPASSPTLSPVGSEERTLSAECENMLPQVTADGPAAGAAEGEDTARATAADRALHDLRSELAAGSRNGAHLTPGSCRIRGQEIPERRRVERAGTGPVRRRTSCRPRKTREPFTLPPSRERKPRHPRERVPS